MTVREQICTREIMHVSNIVSAAYTYARIPWMSITDLATSFKVSQNTINMWLLEAVEKGYVSDINECKIIRNKHVTEYEKKLDIRNSSLRTAYDDALSKRTIPSNDLMSNV